MKKIIICSFIAFACIGCRTVNNRLYPQVSFFTKEIDLSMPVENRIQVAPENVISWLNKMDSTDRYSPYTLTEDEQLLFSNYLQQLPEKYRQIIKEKVVAVYFIENYMGGGMTNEAFDKNGNMYMVWFYNPEILHRTIGDWISYRENSYFNGDSPGISITVECTNEYTALMHTLLHEASHVYDFYYHITPFTMLSLKNENSALRTDFTEMVWVEFNLPIDGYDFFYFVTLFSYGLGPAQSKLLAFGLYEFLLKTPFSTLYASQNWAEDFAESFTWYYLGKYLNCNYKISIINSVAENQEILVYEPMLNTLFTNRFGCFVEIMESGSDDVR
jgi:hypothetical protein